MSQPVDTSERNHPAAPVVTGFLKSLQHGTDELRESARAVFEHSRTGLRVIEDRMSSCLASDAPALKEISSYLLSLGGKRIRPLLALLSAELFGLKTPSPKLIDAASGVELIHMATLLHDDIIDQSPRRRNQESAYVRYGLVSSLLTGDFLWVRAFGLCAHLGPFIVSATERACVELTEGELEEGKLSPQAPQNFEKYLQTVSKKTGSLFSLSCAIGAHCAGASAEQASCMARFGQHAGIAFQMIDDILDVTADEDLLGKPSGTDLKQKTPSLLNILWLASGDESAERFFSLESPSDAETKEALALLRESEVIGAARETAKKYAAFAKAELDTLPADIIDAAAKKRLLTLLDFTLERCL